MDRMDEEIEMDEIIPIHDAEFEENVNSTTLIQDMPTISSNTRSKRLEGDRDKIADAVTTSYRRRKRIGGNSNEPSVNNLDDLVSDMCDELMVQVRNQSGYTYYKSMGFKVMDNLLYLATQGLSSTGVIIGMTQGSSESDSSSKFFFLLGVLSAVNIVLVEINKRYNFGDRSLTIYKCMQDFDVIYSLIRELKISELSGIERLELIREYERKLDVIELTVFDNQVIRTGQPIGFNGGKST